MARELDRGRGVMSDVLSDFRCLAGMAWNMSYAFLVLTAASVRDACAGLWRGWCPGGCPCETWEDA
jgi:hypothetical protein